MIFITKNSTNDVYLTLREKSSIALSSTTAVTYYLFNFRNDQTQQDLYFIPVAITSTTRYDWFRITETGSTSVNLTGGTVSLNPNYFFSYFVYENLTNPYNLYLTGTTGVLIESGKVLVSGGTYQSVFIRYNDSGQTQSNITSTTSMANQPLTKRITYNG